MTDLQVGKTYKVHIDDCCAEAVFTSKLVSITANDNWSSDATFENGVRFETVGAVKFTEVEPTNLVRTPEEFADLEHDEIVRSADGKLWSVHPWAGDGTKPFRVQLWDFANEEGWGILPYRPPINENAYEPKFPFERLGIKDNDRPSR